MWRYLFFLVTFNTIGRLPTRFLYKIFPYVGDLCYMLAAGPRRNVWKNLRHVMPPNTSKSKMRSVARQIFRNVALYYVDLARMPFTDPHDLFDNRLDIHGLDEALLPAVADGKGVIMLSAHCGNPEIAGQALLHIGIKAFALTEPLEPPRLSRLLNNARSSLGLTFAPVNIANVKRVMKTLRSGGVVALMGDRDIHGPRQRLPFFGTETWMPTGPIEVALRTGATVVPSFSGRRSDNYTLQAVMEEPLKLVRTGNFEEDVRAGQVEYIERLERYLRDDPSRWMVLESIWDDDLESASG
jgi:lauroyl/myristoyl acyltransferase